MTAVLFLRNVRRRSVERERLAILLDRVLETAFVLLRDWRHVRVLKAILDPLVINAIEATVSEKDVVWPIKLRL